VPFVVAGGAGYYDPGWFPPPVIDIDAAFQRAGILPDMILSGRAHLYRMLGLNACLLLPVNGG
jgi:hypothetical protein